MSKAKIQVLDPDGKFRGRLRSSKIPTPSWTSGEAAGGPNADVMACDGDPLTGTWLLFARAADNSTVLSCREHTPAQALAWFIANAVQPPAQLVVGARRYWADWLEVRNDPDNFAAITAVAHGRTTSDLDTDVLQHLQRLGLITSGASSKVSTYAEDMGMPKLGQWIDEQVSTIAEWLKQNLGIRVVPSDAPQDKTIHTMATRWFAARERWRSTAPARYQDSNRSADAAELTAATQLVVPVLRRFGMPADAAERLILGLGLDPSRTPKMDRAAQSTQRQLERVLHYISCGALSGAEDLRERRDEWDCQLAEFATEKARRDFKEAFDDDLARPRDDERYVHLLNAARDRRDREQIEIPLDAILAKPVVDHRSGCRRWKDLADHGLRFYSHNNGRPNRVETIGFGDIVAGNRRYGNGKTLPTEILWATEMKAATASLHAIANAAGLTATDRLPISKLVQLLDQILEGEEVDIRAAVKQVEVLVTHAQADEHVTRQRVTFEDALRGRPDLGLSPTPKSTLQRWIRNPTTASDLGANPKGKFVSQMLYVDMLMTLQARRPKNRAKPQRKPRDRHR